MTGDGNYPCQILTITYCILSFPLPGGNNSHNIAFVHIKITAKIKEQVLSSCRVQKHLFEQ